MPLLIIDNGRQRCKLPQQLRNDLLAVLMTILDIVILNPVEAVHQKLSLEHNLHAGKTKTVNKKTTKSCANRNLSISTKSQNYENLHSFLLQVYSRLAQEARLSTPSWESNRKRISVLYVSSLQGNHTNRNRLDLASKLVNFVVCSSAKTATPPHFFSFLYMNGKILSSATVFFKIMFFLPYKSCQGLRLVTFLGIT